MSFIPSTIDKSTEWEDALRKHGVLPKKDTSAEDAEKAAEQAIIDAVERYNPLEAARTVEELDSLEDEADADELEMWKKKRIAELLSMAMKERYGSVVQISEPEYIDEVTKAGEGVWVVLHLFKPGIPDCDLIDHCCQKLAPKFKAVKFLKIIGDQCIHGYPDSCMPTIIIYKDGGLICRLVGIDKLGGKKVTPDAFEWFLSRQGVLMTEILENPLLSGRPTHSSGSVFIDSRRDTRRSRQSDDSDDDDD